MISLIKKSFFYILLGFAFSILIIKLHSQASDLFIMNNRYIINILIAILTLSVAVITLLYSTVDKIRNTIIKVDLLTEEKIQKIERDIREVFNELIEDTLFILYSLIFTLILTLIEGLKIPLFSWPESFFLSKLEFFMICKLTIVILNFVALFDIVHSLFKLIRVSGKISTVSKESSED